MSFDYLRLVNNLLDFYFFRLAFALRFVFVNHFFEINKFRFSFLSLTTRLFSYSIFNVPSFVQRLSY